MTISWLFPSQSDNSQMPPHDRIVSALETLLKVNDADELTQVLEKYSEDLFSSYALATLYLTIVRTRIDGLEDVALRISLCFYLLGYARLHGIAQTHQRAVLLFSEHKMTLGEVFPLLRSEFSELLSLIQETLGSDDYLSIQMVLLRELGDAQAQVFDETLNQIWLERAEANFSLALSLEMQEENPDFRAYFYMRRGVVRFYRQGSERVDLLERAIADFETALSINVSKEEPQFRATGNKLLGQAYTERVYERRDRNLRKAITAYNAALNYFTRSTDPQERLTILQNLSNLHIELREEQQARAAFADMRETASELERLARERLETGETHGPSQRTEPLDSSVVAAIAEEWLEVSDPAKSHAFLVKHQDTLVSDEALALLRYWLAEIEPTNQDGRAEHIASLIRLLENAQMFSPELAWQRYLVEVLPAREAGILLALAESFQEVGQRIGRQLNLFTSLEMIAMLYSFSRATKSEAEAQQWRQLITLLKQLRSGQSSSSGIEEGIVDSIFSSVSEKQQDELDVNLVLKPEQFGQMNLNDPYLQATLHEVTLLSPQQKMELAPYAGQFYIALFSSQTAGFGEIADHVLAYLDREQTPYLWAQFHWLRAAAAMQDPLDNQQQALADCEAALSVVKQDIGSEFWPRIMLMRGCIHMNIVLDDTNHHLSTDERQKHIQQTLQDLTLAETHYVGSKDQLEWAMLQITRAMALTEEAKYVGWTPERFKQVLDDFEAGLPFMTRHGNLWQRIYPHLSRALTLYHYPQPDRQSAIKQVIEDCETVIMLTQPRSSQKMAELWADALIMHGVACTERINVAPGENFAQAIKAFTLALSVYTQTSNPQGWGRALMNRGHAYMQWKKGDISENMEKALKDYNEVLSVPHTQTGTEIAGKALLNRSHCYMIRNLGERTHNQQIALNDCNAALALFHEDGRHFDEASALSNRSNIYMQLLGGNPHENLRLAIADQNAALQIFTPAETPQEWAKTLTSRGMARRHLALSLGYTQRGVGVQKTIQRFFSQHPQSLQNLLAERQNLFEQALADFSDALTILTRSSVPLLWAQTLQERAMTYALQARGYTVGDSKEKIRRAIFDFESALSVLSRYETPYDWASTITNRGVLYSELASKENLDDAAHALADTEAALTIFTRQVTPAKYCRVQYARAEIFFKLEQWSQVHSALLAAREAQRDLVTSAPSSQEQTDVVAEFSLLDIYVKDAWALLQMEPVDGEAIAIALEEGRALAARVALELDVIRLADFPEGEVRERMRTFLKARQQWRKLQFHASQQPTTSETQQQLNTAYNAFRQAREHIRRLDNPDFMTPVPTLQGIGKALQASDEALVYLIAGSPVTEVWGMAVLVTCDSAGNPQVRPIHLPDLSEYKFLDLLEVEGGKTLLVKVDEALVLLGKLGMDKLVASLLQAGIRKLRLVPYGWLGLFPWPSILVPTADGPSYHLSELFAEVTIAPSARSLEIARERLQAQGRQRRTLLIAGNPEPHPPQEDLPYALAEANTVQRIAKAHGHSPAHIRYLPPNQITRQRLIEELAQVRYAHLALHAEYCAGNPRRSRLLLANIDHGDQQARSIYLGEVLDGVVNLQGVRLLALSACETSVIDMQRVPNEALGLAAGFLQAGAAAVIASLWPVDDAATFLLMTHFAQLYLDVQGLWSPGRALATAQHWLRSDATNNVLATYDPVLTQGSQASKLRSISLTYSEARQEIRRQARQELLQGNGEALPYADPFYWAGFVVVGA